VLNTVWRGSILNGPAIIGTGLMANALARTLAAEGHHVSVWGRSPDKAAAMQQDGVKPVEDLQQVLAASELILISIKDYQATQDVLVRAGAALQRKTIVQYSTGTPREARQLADKLRAAACRYLDAAIINYPQAIGTDSCLIYYSGDREAFNQYDEIFAALGGERRFAGEDDGDSNILDQAFLIFYYATIKGMLEAAATLPAGTDWGHFASTLTGSFPVIADTINTSASLIEQRSYDLEEAPIENHLITIESLASEVAAAGVTNSFLPAMKEMVEEVQMRGGSRAHIAALFEQYRAAR
jgi:3-hydroxyisobutyrate dehydrogenase-like beta-hydroxyacid dehydrogenase